MKKRGAFFWNMAGCTVNAGATVVLLAAVTRICGAEEGGVFSIAFVTAQMLMTLGAFGVRAYQASDMEEEFTFPQYLTHRLLTCALMVGAGASWAFLSGYRGEKAAVAVLLCVFKMIDALADVLEGRLQQKGRMDLAGKSLCLRTLLSTTLFVAALWLTEKLTFACILAVAGAAVGLVAFGLLPCRRYARLALTGRLRPVGQLFARCAPLFFSLFILAYLVNAPKYAIDRLLPEQYQTYYNIISMPAQVIYLFSTFIFKPIITDLAEDWQAGRRKKFRGAVTRLLLFTVGTTAATLAAAFAAGIPVLEGIYGVELSPYRTHLLLILVGGGLHGVANLLYYVLTVLRCQGSIFASAGAAFAAALLLPGAWVSAAGMMGAVLSYGAVMLLLALLMLFFLGWKYHKERGKQG